MSDEEKPEETADAPAEDQPEEGEAADGEAKPEGEEAADGEEKPEGAEGEGPPDTGVGDRIKKDPHELSFLVPLPEKIEFHMIPKINDARGVWRIGMRKLEETFAEHIANMHLDFEEKANKYEFIQRQLETNLRFLE
jgi:hypothetical protein